MLWHGLLGLAIALAAPHQASKPDEEFQKLTPDQLKAGIEKRHPAAYYILATKLFETGAKDEAVFWFYAGQLRYRFHLGANPTLPPSGDPALFASLSEVVGRPLNEYAFGDLPHLIGTIDKVLAWDAKTDNAFTPKAGHEPVLKEIRDGLEKMREYVKANGDQIRAQRKQNGLENRKPG